MSEQPENYPREMGSEIPEGAEMREDGSYVQPDKTANIQSSNHDDEGNLITDEDDPDLVSSETADAQMPREQGTDVEGNQ